MHALALTQTLEWLLNLDVLISAVRVASSC